MSADNTTALEYVARLPDGLASFPRFKAKASIVQAVLRDAPEPVKLGQALLPELRYLVDERLAPTDWLPEAHLWGVTLCTYDHAFSGRDGAKRYAEWVYETNRRLLGGILYRVLFAFISPERLLIGGARRLATFHRGMQMEQMKVANGQGTFCITMAPHLLPEQGAVGMASGVRAALELGGGVDVRVEAKLESPTRTVFTASWR